MLFRILNKFFDWDYIAWKNNADRGIARVYKNEDGKAYYFRYKNIKCIDEIKEP